MTTPGPLESFLTSGRARDVVTVIASYLTPKSLKALRNVSKAITNSVDFAVAPQLFRRKTVAANETSLRNLLSFLKENPSTAQHLQELYLTDRPMSLKGYAETWMKLPRAPQDAVKELKRPYNSNLKAEVDRFTSLQDSLYRFLRSVRSLNVVVELLKVAQRPLLLTCHPDSMLRRQLVKCGWLDSVSVQSLVEDLFIKASVVSGRRLKGVFMRSELGSHVRSHREALKVPTIMKMMGAEGFGEDMTVLVLNLQALSRGTSVLATYPNHLADIRHI